MIAVIADDFTGAAELAGISLRFGMKVELFLGDLKEASADVLIVCTDSRSMEKTEALRVTKRAVTAIVNLKPSFIYKKIDSVLRGYVVDEIKVQMGITGQLKAFVLPANPSLKRTISNGEYFIDGKRITESGFVNDPEFPILSNSVMEMLQSDKVMLAKRREELPDDGIVIGEAATNNDVERWANELDSSWMMAGAGDFFTAILKKNGRQYSQSAVILQSPLLYVCGTAFQERKQFVKQLQEEQACVAYLPEDITDEWLNDLSKIVSDKQKLVIAVDQSSDGALLLRNKMAKSVKAIVERNEIKEIFIEGGSTAAAVLNELQVDCLQPTDELSRGVVRMKAKDIFITVKPGSYQLPHAINHRMNS